MKKTESCTASAVPRTQNRWFYHAVKKGFDFVFSFLFLIVLSPLFLVVTVVIRLNSPGPALFIQDRVGKDGRIFKMYKFRSMYRDAEEKLAALEKLNERDGPVFKMRNDPRITSVGRFIRKTCIDELPQLLNILRGEMSFVGPRPALPHEVEQYTPYQYGRLAAEPGLTCYWQVNKSSAVTFDDWVELDLRYIRERGIWVDLKLIFATVRVVLTAKGEE